MALKCFASSVPLHATYDHVVQLTPVSSALSSPPESLQTRRGILSVVSACTIFSISVPFSAAAASSNNQLLELPNSGGVKALDIRVGSGEVPAASSNNQLLELPNSGGVKALDIRVGSGEVPADGDQVAIHYYGRLAAKQGWRFDSTYDHKDDSGEPIPFNFVLGSRKVISGIEVAVKSMRVGGIRRVIIPPSQGYQNTTQEPIPPNFFDRQRLFTTIFNPTRLANGEGSTLGTLMFDIELVSLRHNSDNIQVPKDDF